MQPGDPEGVLNLQWESTKEAATCNWACSGRAQRRLQPVTGGCCVQRSLELFAEDRKAFFVSASVRHFGNLESFESRKADWNLKTFVNLEISRN